MPDLLTASGVSKTYFDPHEGHDVLALNGVSLNVAAHEFVSLIVPKARTAQTRAVPLIGLAQDGLAAFEPAFVDLWAIGVAGGIAAVGERMHRPLHVPRGAEQPGLLGRDRALGPGVRQRGRCAAACRWRLWGFR